MTEEPEEELRTGATCTVVDVWELLGRRWSLHILKNLKTKEVIRFNELKRSLPGISSTAVQYYLSGCWN
ncbi:MAG: winged helix-turn-helix transcriptional regulator [Nitrososphaera sp.]